MLLFLLLSEINIKEIKNKIYPTKLSLWERLSLQEGKGNINNLVGNKNKENKNNMYNINLN